ncbi:MAG: histidine kinase [Bacillota bacterium]|jgi:acetoin utilization protein AcuB|nr:histidine kinase [Bacillota bacterium]
MYVKSRMTSNPYTIAFDAPISEALTLMSEKNLKRLPVVDKEKVVGILTQGDIQKVSPTKATSLSIFEINYLLSKTKVKDAMTKNAITVSQDCLLEEAAVMMRDNRIGTLPVVDNGKLVGIITESDIFDAFIELLGFKDKGSRITIESLDIPGSLADIAEAFETYNANITHAAVYRGTGKSDVVVRTNALNTEDIEKKLTEQGYKIVHKIVNDK